MHLLIHPYLFFHIWIFCIKFKWLLHSCLFIQFISRFTLHVLARFIRHRLHHEANHTAFCWRAAASNTKPTKIPFIFLTENNHFLANLRIQKSDYNLPKRGMNPKCSVCANKMTFCSTLQVCVCVCFGFMQEGVGGQYWYFVFGFLSVIN